MLSSQPIASMMVTASQRYVLTAADFNASSPYSAAIEDLRFICGITCIYTHSSTGPHYLSLLPDIAGGSPTEAPLDEIEVEPSIPSATVLHRVKAWFPPLAADRIDIAFATGPWGGSGRAFFKPSGDILVIVHAYPSRFTG